MGREFRSIFPIILCCHCKLCPILVNQNYSRGNNESQLGPGSGRCDRENVIVDDLINGRNI